MADSFTTMKHVKAEWLTERIEGVQNLSKSDHESYDIVKDAATGEFYLNYSYMQLDLTAGGNTEVWYHQLMSIDHDDVIALAVGEQAFTYPDHWKQPFLRNGPGDRYVWFSPEYAEDFDENLQIGQDIAETLKQFKAEGKHDIEAVKQLFAQLDELHNKKDDV